MTLLWPLVLFQGNFILCVLNKVFDQNRRVFCCSAHNFLDQSQSACNLQTHKKTPWSRTQCIQTHLWHGWLVLSYLLHTNHFLYARALSFDNVPHQLRTRERKERSTAASYDTLMVTDTNTANVFKQSGRLNFCMFCGQVKCQHRDKNYIFGIFWGILVK